MSPSPDEEVVARDAGDLLALATALVAVPSVSGEEARLADAVERRLRLRAPGLRVERVANNVVARTDAGRDRRVVLGGHLDTVPPSGNEQPRVDGDTLWGIGAADMKGSVAVLLALAESAARRLGDRDLTFVLYEGEEIAEQHNGLRHLFATAPDLVVGDLAVLLEPTGGWVEAGCQGTLVLRALFRGRRAHSARPWMGVNAIHRAAPTLARLAAFEAEEVAVDGLRYQEALQVVGVEGGVRNNVVPDSCAVTVNRRFAPSRDVEAALAEVRDLLADADDVEVLNLSAASPPNLGHPLVAELVGALDLPVRPKLGWTDVARFTAHGIPALNLGAGDPTLAHGPDERVERADLDGCAAVLARFCGLEA